MASDGKDPISSAKATETAKEEEQRGERKRYAKCHPHGVHAVTKKATHLHSRRGVLSVSPSLLGKVYWCTLDNRSVTSWVHLYHVTTPGNILPGASTGITRRSQEVQGEL